jgi:hypothetical protein
MDAVSSGAPVIVPDLKQPADVLVERWPTFMEAAAAAGVRALFALPLRIGAISVGALDLYRDLTGDLREDEVTAALMAADAAALALLNLDTKREGAFDVDPNSRSTYELQVHQATGMVMVQADVGVEDAFLMLRARAFASDRSLREVAMDVVDLRLRFSSEDK